MDPIKQLLSAIAQGLKDQADGSRVITAGGVPYTMFIRPEPDVEFRVVPVRATDAERPAFAEYTRYVLGSERPAGYPANLPFTPGHRVSVMVLQSGNFHLTSSWEDVDDVDSLIDELVAQSVGSAWRREEPGPQFRMPGLTSRRERLSNGDRVRNVIGMSTGTEAGVSIIDG